MRPFLWVRSRERAFFLLKSPERKSVMIVIDPKKGGHTEKGMSAFGSGFSAREKGSCLFWFT